MNLTQKHKKRVLELWAKFEGNITVAELARFIGVSVDVINRILDDSLKNRKVENKHLEETPDIITEDDLLTITEERHSLNFKILPWTI